MNLFRNRIFVALFFFLITLGQAYPYAFAYTMKGEMQCTCNLRGHKCIHGCDLHHHHHHGRIQKESKSDKPRWINPLCAQQKQRNVLSFKWEPFLLGIHPVVLNPMQLSFRFQFSPSYEIYHSSPADPPPRATV